MATMEKRMKSRMAIRISADLLAKALDFQFDRSNITPFMMDRTRNANAANRILTQWAQVLVKGLQESGVKSTSQR